jgi:hypothetical protein
LETLLTLKRKWFTDKSTCGELWFDGEFQCFTLEDKVRDVKIPKETAIPDGKYEVVLSFSNRFQKYLPEVLHVENFTGVRLHPGNTASDSEGCILLGDTRGQDFVGNSRAAFAVFMSKLDRAARHGKVWLQILNCKNESAAVA